MRFKRAVLILLVLVMPAALRARPSSPPAFEPQDDCEAIRSNDAAARPIKLDLNGTRGVVVFRHRHHERYLNSDGQFAHQPLKGAECAGCHHKRSESSGAPMLAKCGACHGGEGDPGNPRNRDLDEEWSGRAFHDLCIGCHRASNEKGLVKCDKAPVACSECHGSKP